MENLDFERAAWEAFQEAAAEKYDFTTCQRSDGSYYGTAGQCRKGTETKKPPAKKDQKMANMRAKDLKRRGASRSDSDFRTRPKAAIEADMKKLTSSGAMQQKGQAGIDARKKFTDLKAEKSKPLKGANTKTGDGKMSADEKKDLQVKASKGDKDAMKKLNEARAAGKIGKESGFGPKEEAIAPAPPKTTKKDPVKSVQNEQKKTKDFLKEDNKKIAKENPGLAQKNLQVKNKKLGEEYERLRGDKSPQATARRKKIMEDVNKNMNKIKELDKKEAAKNTSRDSSPAGAQRRANAAARAKD